MLLPCLPCLSLCHPSLAPTFSLYLKSAHRLRGCEFSLLLPTYEKSSEESPFPFSTLSHTSCHNRAMWSGSLGLCKRFLSRPNTEVIASVGDTSSPSVQELSYLANGPGDTVMTIKIDMTSPTDAKNAAQALQTHHQILKLDFVPRQCLGPELDRCPTRCCRSCAIYFIFRKILESINMLVIL